MNAEIRGFTRMLRGHEPPNLHHQTTQSFNAFYDSAASIGSPEVVSAKIRAFSAFIRVKQLCGSVVPASYQISKGDEANITTRQSFADAR